MALSSFSLVVIVTFALITLITFRALSGYYKVFTFLSNIDREKVIEDTAFYQNLKRDFSQNNDEESFVAAYVGGYKLDNGKGLIAPLKWAQSAGNMVILLGVLGTFIGLVLSLATINYNQMNDSVLQLLGGIHTAFYTSIIGISASVLIRFFMKRWHADQLLIQVMLKLENALKKESAKDDKMIAALQDVHHAVAGVHTSLSGLNLFSEKFAEGSRHLEQFNQQFGKNIEKLTGLFSDVAQLADGLHSQTNTLNDQFPKVIHAFSLQESLIAGLEDSLKKFTDRLLETSHLQEKQQLGIEQFLASIKEQKAFLISFKGSMDQFLAEQQQLSNGHERMEEKNNQLLGTVSQATASLKDVIDQGAFRQLGELTISLTSQMQRLDQQFQQFQQFLQRSEQKETEFIRGFDRHQQQIKEEHMTFSNILQNFVGQNEMVDISLKETVRVFKSYEANGQRLVEEMKQVSGELNRKFADQDRLFQRNADSLNHYLMDVSDQSAKGLEQAVRRTEDALHTTIETMIRQLERQQETQVHLLERKLDHFAERLADANKVLLESQRVGAGAGRE